MVDNTKIQQYLKWEPDTRLRDGMKKTYDWILAEFKAKYNARSAGKSSLSTFTKGSHPIPGDGFNPESKFMDTWTQGIPAGYGKPERAATKVAAKKVVAKKVATKKVAAKTVVAKKAPLARKAVAAKKAAPARKR